MDETDDNIVVQANNIGTINMPLFCTKKKTCMYISAETSQGSN